MKGLEQTIKKKLMNIISKYKYLPKPAKSFFWFMVCNFFLKGISFLSAPIFTRLLTDSEYGKLTLFLTYEQIINILATWEIQNGAYQKGLFKYEKMKKEYTIATQLQIGLMTSFLFIIMIPFYRLIHSLTKFNSILVFLLYLSILIKPSYDCWLIRKRMDYEYKVPVLIIFIYSISNIFFPILMINLIKANANVKFGTNLIISILLGIFFYIQNIDYRALKNMADSVKKYWIFNIHFQGPAVLHSLSYLILSQADRIMIDKYVSSKEVAYYSVAYSIASVVSIVQTSLIQSLRPWFYSTIERREFLLLRRVTFGLVAGVGCIVIVFLGVIPEVIRFVFPSNYSESLWCIPPITVGIYFVFLYSLFVTYEEYYEKTQYVMYVSVICAIINILLNYFGIKVWGYIACAYTTLISYIFFAFGHYLFMERVRIDENSDEKPFYIRGLFGISIGVCIMSLGIILLYNHPIIRYIFLGGLLLILLYMRERIFDFIKNVLRKTNM